MKHQQHLENLTELKGILSRNTRFLSFSGVAGVIAGVIALIGEVTAVLYYLSHPEINLSEKLVNENGLVFIAICGLVMALSISIGYVLTNKNIIKSGEKLNPGLIKNTLLNICLPIAVGGVICIMAYMQGNNLVIPSYMLLFYGLALFGGSKYSFDDLKMVGSAFILLGMVSYFDPRLSIYTWGLGFGILHIIYGLQIYFQKERKRA
jgi:hypothetical protein